MPSSESQQVKTKIQESEYSQNQGLSSYSHSEYLEPRKDKPKNPQTCDIIQGKWSDEEKIKYVLFVYNHFKIFKSKMKRKNLRVFKTLSQYLGTRTPRQCRSHFQKLMNRFKNIKKMIEYHQNESGMAEFLQMHKAESRAIQRYPLQNQTSQKPTVAYRDCSSQTDFPEPGKQYEAALARIKLLENMLLETNLRLVHAQNFIFPLATCLNLPRY